MGKPTSYTKTKPRIHPEGYAVDVRAGEAKLATVYGASVSEVDYRAALVRRWFEAEWTPSAPGVPGQEVSNAHP